MEYRENSTKDNKKTENLINRNQDNTKRYYFSRKHLIFQAFLIPLGIGMFTYPKAAIMRKHTYLEVNDKYITGCTGVFNKTVQNSPISQITAVRVNQGILGRWLNYGDILISTANGQYHYTAMESPEGIQQHILSLL